MTQHAIGKRFIYEGTELLVVKSGGCAACFFNNGRNGCIRPRKDPMIQCSPGSRYDHTPVLFIEPHKYPAAKLLGEIE